MKRSCVLFLSVLLMLSAASMGFAAYPEKTIQGYIMWGAGGGTDNFARAITPPRRPKRFDTRFFAIDASAVAKRIDGIIGPDSELVDLVWVDFDEAKELDLPTITKVIIQEVEARIEGGFAPWLPVPFYWEKRGSFVREEL